MLIFLKGEQNQAKFQCLDNNWDKKHVINKQINKSSGATALQGFGRQSGRRSAKLVPTFAIRGVSRGQRNGSPRPLISVYRT